MVLSDQLPGTAGIAGTPVPGRNVGYQPVHLAERFGPFDYYLPGAFRFRIDLTLTVLRPATRAVQQFLGAPAYRAHARETIDYAIPTTQAFLGEDPLLLQYADEGGVHAGQRRCFGEPAGDHLHAGAAGQGQHSLVAGDG